MSASSQEELGSLHAAAPKSDGDTLVRWQSTFGLIIIETRGGHVFVNGDRVEPAHLNELKDGE